MVGPIPESVSTMEHLEGLYLHDNYLTGGVCVLCYPLFILECP